MNIESHSWTITQLEMAQKADHDQREKARDADLFTTKKDGQWEPYWWNAAGNEKPRYTFDMTSPIVDQICGEIERAEFGIKVDPNGGDASEDTAEVLQGLVRNIQNISMASDVYNAGARGMVNSGIDGWRVVQKYVSDDSFEQDLIIEHIPSFKDRVWFNETFEDMAAEDAKLCFVMQTLAPADYKERWPKGSQESVTSDQENNAYFNKPDVIVVGEVYYFKETAREMVLMSNGKVYSDEQLKDVADELKRLGITEKKRRKSPQKRVYTRKFDGKGWLEEEKETVFSSMIPVVPLFGNFNIIENKVTYRGVVEKLIDPQRILNYSMSREIEEGALAPRAKKWLTATQVAGHEDTIQTLNTNADPVQLYKFDPDLTGQPQITETGGAQINPGLRTISQTMQETIGHAANMFAPNMGNNPNAQSGVAIKRLQDKGDTGTSKYFSSLERAITKTARILIDTAPEIYTKGRKVRSIEEDGTTKMVTLGEEIQDVQTGQLVVLNDLSAGNYDVVCSSGPSFQNRQQETVESMIEIAGVDPTIIELGGDILLNNITAPGMRQIAARKRAQLFNAGMIPFDQMSEEEQQQFQQMQAMQAQNPQNDPATMLAEAEQGKAQADLITAQTKQVTAQTDLQKAQAGFGLDERAQTLDEAKFNHDVKQSQVDQLMDVQRMQMEQTNSMMSDMKAMAETMRLIRESMGVDAIVTEAGAEAFDSQAELLLNSQNEVN